MGYCYLVYSTPILSTYFILKTDEVSTYKHRARRAPMQSNTLQHLIETTHVSARS